MLTRYILPSLAVVGLLFAVLFTRAGSKPAPASQPIALPAQPPFQSYIAGAGIIEASTENIAIGTFVPGVVREMFAKVGDDVKAGQPLFKIDDRDLQAELIVRKAALQSAVAKVKVDQATLEDVTNQLEMWQAVSDPRAVSKEVLERRRYAVDIQKAKLDQSKSEIGSGEAQVEATITMIDRLTVRAPVAGRLLQVKIRLGEFAPAGITEPPLMLLGDVSTLHVRVDIDENDAWRLKTDAPARAFIKGNKDLSTALRFVRIEPYVVPKRSLTGESSERVDTRVLQAVYAFDGSALPVYVGQQMDVYIEAPALFAPAEKQTPEVVNR